MERVTHLHQKIEYKLTTYNEKKTIKSTFAQQFVHLNVKVVIIGQKLTYLHQKIEYKLINL